MILTDDELSALIEACNVANNARGQDKPRPPWNRAGPSAHRKLIELERSRGVLVKELEHDS